MPWKRGEGTVEVELSRTQDWIERADEDFYGGNGEKGMLQQFHDDRAFLKGALAMLVFFGGGNFVLDILRAIGFIKH